MFGLFFSCRNIRNYYGIWHYENFSVVERSLSCEFFYEFVFACKYDTIYEESINQCFGILDNILLVTIRKLKPIKEIKNFVHILCKSGI